MRIDALLPAITARLATISHDAPLLEAARLFGSGAYRMLVVCTEDGRAAGILTRTDAMRHIGEHAEPLVSRVAEVMTTSFISTRLSDDLLSSWRAMAAAKFNHLPVLHETGEPVGTLTADDALKALLEAEDYEEGLLRDYIAGLGYR